MDVDATIAGLDALASRLRDTTRQVTADAAHLIQAQSMGFAPVGVAGNSTNTPGDLRRSILVDGPHQVSDDSWLAHVGPTTVYGRQRELGGDIYPQRARVLRFEKFGETVFASHVYQKPEPYMKPGLAAARPEITAVVADRYTAAITGG